MVTMLLLAPVCWDHYLLLLALPLALVWSGLGRSNLQRLAFLLLVAAVWVGPNELWRVGGVDLVAWPDFQDVPPRTYLIHRPLFVLAFLSVHFYALLALYLWVVFLLRRKIAGAESKAELLRGRVASSPRVKAAQCPRSLAQHVGTRGA